MHSLQAFIAVTILGVSTPALADSPNTSAAPAPTAGDGDATQTGSPTAATGGPATAPPAVAVAKVDPAHDPDKVICHYITPTGSRLGGQKVCQTRRDWERLSRDSEDMVNHATSSALQRSPPGN